MTKKRDDDEPMTLSDLISEVFEVGFEAAMEDVHKDAQDALKDPDVCGKLERVHEKFGADMLYSMETFLDMGDDPDEEDEK